VDKEKIIPFDECSRRGLDDQVVVLVSKYCSACKVVLPILKEIEQELNMEFLYFDLSDKDDVEKFDKFKIQAQWTPTVIIGCEVLIGGYSKEKYETVIKNL
jgi:thiol-disulfide isomerase/thioredoxin